MYIDSQLCTLTGDTTMINEILCYKINYLARLLLSELNDQIKPFGVTQGQVPVLCSLDRNEGQTQTELCKAIQVEQPTMANTLRRMERDGLIYRTNSKQDKRQARVFISEETLPIVDFLKKEADRVVAKMTQKMTPDDFETFNKFIDLSIEALEHSESETIEEKL